MPPIPCLSLTQSQMKLLKHTPGTPPKPLNILLHSQMPSKLLLAQGSTWFFPQLSFPRHSMTRRHSQNSRLSITDMSLQCLLPLHTQPHVCAQKTAFFTTQFRCQHQSTSPSSYRVWLSFAWVSQKHRALSPPVAQECLEIKSQTSSSWQ